MPSPVEPRLRGVRNVLDDRIIAKSPSGDGHREHFEIIGVATDLVERWEALHVLRTTRDPTQTDAAHAKRVQLAVAKFAKDTEAALVRMNKSWANGFENIDARIRAKTKLNPDPAYASEIRHLYRSMSSSERVKLLSELIEGGRGPELAAIISAPKSLTGLPDQQRRQYEAAFISRHAPDEIREQEALQEVFDAALVIEREARGFAAAHSDPRRLEEITRAEAAAAAAQARFDKAPS
jgi:hypothetical protein